MHWNEFFHSREFKYVLTVIFALLLLYSFYISTTKDSITIAFDTYNNSLLNKRKPKMMVRPIEQPQPVSQYDDGYSVTGYTW